MLLVLKIQAVCSFNGKKEGEYDRNIFWGDATKENIQALIEAEVVDSKEDLELVNRERK